MSWRSIDFQGLMSLDHKIVEHLEIFLKEKENRLSHDLLSLIPSYSQDAFSPALPAGALLKLSEVVEIIGKKFRSLQQIQEERIASKDSQYLLDKLNHYLWEYTEVLEGCVTELFQQIRQIPIDRWHVSISQVVSQIKDLLMHRFEDLVWTIRRLEKLLKDYYAHFSTKPKGWFEWRILGETYIDPSLIRNIHQSEKTLKTQEVDFNRRYQHYKTLIIKTEEYLDQMKGYPILALLDVPDQNLYVDVFRLLKMLELNQQAKKEIATETSQALKQLASIDHIMQVFRTYLKELRFAFFNSSLEWKSFNREEENFKDVLEKLKDKVSDYQQELQHFLHTLGQYRTFILKNDPNPYVRSRLGFSEWIVGPESPQARKLTKLIYSAEELKSFYHQLFHSLSQDNITQISEHQSHQVTDKLLHEMSQPLISRSLMHQRASRLLDQLKECNEIGSPYMSTVYYIDDILSKVMRDDWKYHVLHEFPLFHQIYRIHRGLMENISDPAHAFRIERFHLLFDQIEGWVNKGDVYAHVHEIEIDMNDIKTYLQDFLASIQRAVREKSHDPFLDETIYRFRQQLLEYRYLFGQFFSAIMNKNQEGSQLRNQFLFVDQYFESVENLLHELKMSWEGKR